MHSSPRSAVRHWRPSSPIIRNSVTAGTTRPVLSGLGDVKSAGIDRAQRIGFGQAVADPRRVLA